MPGWVVWCGGEGGGGRGGRNSGTKRFFFFFFILSFPLSLSWWIEEREEHGKRRKGGNKSVATNMSVARLFIGTRGKKDEAASLGQDIVFKGWIQDVVL